MKGRSPAVGVCFFSLPCVGWFCTVLGWVILGWVRLLLPVPRTQEPFFLLPITTRCAQTCFKNSDPSLSPDFSSKQVAEATAGARSPNLVGNMLSYTDRNAHTHTPLVTGTQTNTAWLRHCNHRGPKGIPEQEWTPITCFSTLGAHLIHRFPQDM